MAQPGMEAPAARPAQDRHLHARIDAELSEALDAFAEEANVDRSTAVRLLLAAGLKKGPTRALLLDVVTTYQAQLKRVMAQVTATLTAELPRTVSAELGRIEQDVAAALSGPGRRS